MSFQLEVCIDSLESLQHALTGGATRIELCSSLALGGLTPSAGLMKIAAQTATVPVYAMIRARQGDFLYSEADLAAMLIDIEMAAQVRLQGVVFGALTADGDIDITATRTVVNKAHELGLAVTFHRAIDLCRNIVEAVTLLSDLGCERILTSGGASSALEGADTISAMHVAAQGKISIMAGAGVNADNIAAIHQTTGIHEFHLSGKTSRPSQMRYQANQAQMGQSDIDDFSIPTTSSTAIENAKSRLLKLNREQPSK